MLKGSPPDEVLDEIFGRIMCYDCKHWNGDNTCLAFPGQIPIPIISGRVAHILPYENDNGIQFEVKES